MFKFACFDKDHIWLKKMLQREFIYGNQENGDISIFAFPLATVPLVACNFLTPLDINLPG